MTTCAAGRVKPPSFCRRIEYSGNSISDQCPIAVCTPRTTKVAACRLVPELVRCFASEPIQTL